MTYILDERTLNCIWEALQEEPLPLITKRQKHVTNKVLKEGWLFLTDLTDLIEAMDSRLIGKGLDLQKFSEILGCHWEAVFYSSDAKKKEPFGFAALKSTEVLQFLIMLERLGFRVESKILTESLYPKIKSNINGLITSAELDILRFQNKQDKGQCIEFCIEDWLKDAWELSEIQTPQGYKIEANLTKEGKPVRLIAFPPKYRKPPKTFVIKCQECGSIYQKGNPEESKAHHTFHKRVMTWLNPRPLAEFLSERQSNPEPELVTLHSPYWKHKQMFERAVAFKREFHFDFFQWNDPRDARNPLAQGFLFADEDGAIIGACAFKEINRGKSWCLDWVWICPKERRKGHLSKRWPKFKARYGDFSVEKPISDEMQSFLRKWKS